MPVGAKVGVGCVLSTRYGGERAREFGLLELSAHFLRIIEDTIHPSTTNHHMGQTTLIQTGPLQARARSLVGNTLEPTEDVGRTSGETPPCETWRVLAPRRCM